MFSCTLFNIISVNCHACSSKHNTGRTGGIEDKKTELRDDGYMYQLSRTNVLTMYYKHAPIKIQSKIKQGKEQKKDTVQKC